MKSIALEHAYGISTQEAKAGALQDLGPPELCDETLSQEEGGWRKQVTYKAAAGCCCFSVNVKQFIFCAGGENKSFGHARPASLLTDTPSPKQQLLF